MKEEKSFVFPMNYSKKEKLLGFIDYKAGGIIGVIAFILFWMLKLINISIKVKSIIFVGIISAPMFLLLIGINGESAIDFFKYMIKFSFGEKIYIYRKSLK